MLLKENAIGREVQQRKSGGPRCIYLFNCKEKGCIKVIRCRTDELKKYTGFCPQHSQRKRPFESIYNGLYNDHRKIKIELTYEEFLEFTNVKNCYYCNAKINWIEYSSSEKEYFSRAYYLDRKINSGPYSKENCVVCCTLCNKFKRTLDHNEFIVLCSFITQHYSSKLIKDPSFGA